MNCDRCKDLGVVAVTGGWPQVGPGLRIYCHCAVGEEARNIELKQLKDRAMGFNPGEKEHVHFERATGIAYASPVTKEVAGRKDDSGKPRFELLRFGLARAIAGVVRVLTFGAKKYADHSWQRVPDGINRYYGALDRHLNAIGEEGTQARDPETGLLHIEHVACNALFLCELTYREADEIYRNRPSRNDSVREGDGQR